MWRMSGPEEEASLRGWEPSTTPRFRTSPGNAGSGLPGETICDHLSGTPERPQKKSRADAGLRHPTRDVDRLETVCIDREAAGLMDMRRLLAEMRDRPSRAVIELDVAHPEEAFMRLLLINNTMVCKGLNSSGQLVMKSSAFPETPVCQLREFLVGQWGVAPSHLPDDLTEAIQILISSSSTHLFAMSARTMIQALRDRNISTPSTPDGACSEKARDVNPACAHASPRPSTVDASGPLVADSPTTGHGEDSGDRTPLPPHGEPLGSAPYDILARFMQSLDEFANTPETGHLADRDQGAWTAEDESQPSEDTWDDLLKDDSNHVHSPPRGILSIPCPDYSNLE